MYPRRIQKRKIPIVIPKNEIRNPNRGSVMTRGKIDTMILTASKDSRGYTRFPLMCFLYRKEPTHVAKRYMARIKANEYIVVDNVGVNARTHTTSIAKEQNPVINKTEKTKDLLYDKWPTITEGLSIIFTSFGRDILLYLYPR